MASMAAHHAPSAPLAVLTSCHAEQDWNRAQLAVPVLFPALRLWTYRAPAIVLGCGQQRTVFAQGEGAVPLDRVVRQAGGGAVLAGPWMLSASIVLPPDHPRACGSIVDSYRWLGEATAAVLQGFNIAAHPLTPDESRTLQQDDRRAALAWACFGGYSPWEVVVGHKKIAGLAQVRRRTGTLLVAGILLHAPDWRLLSRALDQPDAHAQALADCTTSVAQQCACPVTAEDIARPLLTALAAALVPPVTGARRTGSCLNLVPVSHQSGVVKPF